MGLVPCELRNDSRSSGPGRHHSRLQARSPTPRCDRTYASQPVSQNPRSGCQRSRGNAASSANGDQSRAWCGPKSTASRTKSANLGRRLRALEVVLVLKTGLCRRPNETAGNAECIREHNSVQGRSAHESGGPNTADYRRQRSPGSHTIQSSVVDRRAPEISFRFGISRTSAPESSCSEATISNPVKRSAGSPNTWGARIPCSPSHFAVSGPRTARTSISVVDSGARGLAVDSSAQTSSRLCHAKIDPPQQPART